MGERQFSVSIILPAYNESPAVGEVVAELKELYPDYELLVVDDGSDDDTGAVAQAAGARVVRHKRNRGYGASWKNGVRLARGETVVFFDADGQFDPHDVARLLAIMPECDMAVGARSRDSHVPPERRPGKFVLQIVADLLTDTQTPDLNCGLRAVRREVISRYLHLLPDGFSASTTATIALLKRGYRVEFVPVLARARKGKSTVNPLRDGFGTIMLIVRLIALFDPLRLFLPASLLLQVLGWGWGLRYIITGRGLSVGALLLILTSVLTFFFGILCDQVAALRQERFERWVED
jgi:glycosyltransferase involved in cell wall biosynthesis